jgi:hypothetical protein
LLHLLVGNDLCNQKITTSSVDYTFPFNTVAAYTLSVQLIPRRL